MLFAKRDPNKGESGASRGCCCPSEERTRVGDNNNDTTVGADVKFIGDVEVGGSLDSIVSLTPSTGSVGFSAEDDEMRLRASSGSGLTMTLTLASIGLLGTGDDNGCGSVSVFTEGPGG